MWVVGLEEKEGVGGMVRGRIEKVDIVPVVGAMLEGFWRCYEEVVGEKVIVGGLWKLHSCG